MQLLSSTAMDSTYLTKIEVGFLAHVSAIFESQQAIIVQ